MLFEGPRYTVSEKDWLCVEGWIHLDVGLELIARCFPCIPNTWLHNWKLSEINRWVHLVVLGILPTDARYEVWGSTLSEVVYDRCYYQELHLKGSLAMLIRGLQNLFVTRSYAFSTKMLERNSSLVFVPFRTLLFLLFILLIPMWLLVKTDVIN